MSTNFFHRVPVGLVGTETNREPMDGEPRQKSRTTKASAMHRLEADTADCVKPKDQPSNFRRLFGSSPPPHSTPLLVRR